MLQETSISNKCCYFELPCSSANPDF